MLVVVRGGIELDSFPLESVISLTRTSEPEDLSLITELKEFRLAVPSPAHRGYTFHPSHPIPKTLAKSTVVWSIPHLNTSVLCLFPFTLFCFESYCISTSMRWLDVLVRPRSLAFFVAMAYTRVLQLTPKKESGF